MSRGLALLALLLAVAHAGPRPVALAPDAALLKARVNGRYRMLLRQVRVPDDHKRYGVFKDYGMYPALTQYEGHKNLPAGHWVYVHPTWYIWRDLATKKWTRPWGPEQAAGAPNSTGGDRRTAWALALLVYENHYPGALRKVTVFSSDGTEVVVWEGKDPVRGGIALIPVRVDFKVMRVKLHVASKAVKGWNEIDAVGLLDGTGRTHWAAAAQASSFYGDRTVPAVRLPLPVIRPGQVIVPTPFRLVPDAQETERLRREVEELKRRVAELEKKAGSGK
jgi:hypothetical protein